MSSLISLWDVLEVQGQLTLQSMVKSGRISILIREFMVVLLTCKNGEDLFKNEGTRVPKRLYIVFSDTQGQLTPQSVVDSSRS